MQRQKRKTFERALTVNAKCELSRSGNVFFYSCDKLVGDSAAEKSTFVKRQ